MLNPQESTIELKKYLKKLSKIIDKEASFTLIKTKIVDKKKIDDVLCCIEASFPDEYKTFVKRKGAKKLRSQSYYVQMLDAIKNKFLFSSSCYSVRHNEALSYINSIISNIDSDINFIFSDASGMF